MLLERNLGLPSRPAGSSAGVPAGGFWSPRSNHWIEGEFGEPGSTPATPLYVVGPVDSQTTSDWVEYLRLGLSQAGSGRSNPPSTALTEIIGAPRAESIEVLPAGRSSTGMSSCRRRSGKLPPPKLHVSALDPFSTGIAKLDDLPWRGFDAAQGAMRLAQVGPYRRSDYRCGD